MRPELLRRIHNSHLGIEGCLRRAREHVYWPGLNREVKDFVQPCDICQAFSHAQPREPFHCTSVPERPWQEVGSDLFQLDGDNFLVTVDYFSNFAELDRLSSTVTAAAVITKFKQHFARHGIPEVLRTDNGPQFNCHEFRQFTLEWNFVHITSSPAYPQSNGKSENAVKMYKNLFRKAKEGKQDPWLAVLDFRNTPTQGLAISPARRLLGRRTRTLLPTHSSLLPPAFPGVSREQSSTLKAKQATYYNAHAQRCLQPLQAGDHVRMPMVGGGRRWIPAVVQGRVQERSL